MTAAGTVTPAKVFVLGAGVAGLQAIATARRLGAVVCAYDVRPAVKEQVESVGAKFVIAGCGRTSVRGQGRLRQSDGRSVLSPPARADDGRAARTGRGDHDGRRSRQQSAHPDHRRHGERHAPGSVIVDIAAERGGNCELTRPGETIVHNGVTILGPVNLPSMVPVPRQPDACLEHRGVSQAAGRQDGSVCGRIRKMKSSAKRW